mgnify:CR=1 FL=1
MRVWLTLTTVRAILEIGAWRPRCPTVLSNLRSIGLLHSDSGRYSTTLFKIQGHYEKSADFKRDFSYIVKANKDNRKGSEDNNRLHMLLQEYYDRKNNGRNITLVSTHLTIT